MEQIGVKNGDMTKEQLVTKWIDDMTAKKLMNGYFNDRSEKFKKKQFDVMMKVLDGDVELIGGNYRLLATIHSDYGNLKQYCGWKERELKQLLGLFGFSEIEQVTAVMRCKPEKRNRIMQKCKLIEGIRFYLTPHDENGEMD